MIDETQSEIYRKKHGIYYTPQNLATLIVDNAVNKRELTIFDPSFGNAILLKTAGEKLFALGNQSPENNLYGVDIDSTTLTNLKNPDTFQLKLENLLIDNFLSIEPNSLKDSPYDVILSNPPFTRHHDISPTAKIIAKQALKKNKIEIAGFSGYWAYFLIHSLQFLKKGGTLSILVPYALLDAAYSKRLKEIIEFCFEFSSLHILKPKYFLGVQEHVLLLDARKYQGLDNTTKGDFQLILNGLDGNSETGEIPTTKEWNIESLLLSSKAREMLTKLYKHSDFIRLGDVARIRIGVVTGGNQYFILPQSVTEKLDLNSEFIQPIITKSNMINCLFFGKSHFDKIRKEDEPAFLLKLDKNSEVPSSLKRYLQNKESSIVKKRYQCRIRKPWYAINIGDMPDAFLHYMATDSPRLVLNKTDVTSTNTIHRIYWKHKMKSRMVRVCALSSITTLSNLSTEILGRRLSGGLLKVEPSQALSMLLPIPDIDIDNSDWKLVNAFLEKREIDYAIQVADRIILENGFGMNSRKITFLNKDYKRMKQYRSKRNI